MILLAYKIAVDHRRDVAGNRVGREIPKAFRRFLFAADAVTSISSTVVPVSDDPDEDIVASQVVLGDLVVMVEEPLESLAAALDYVENYVDANEDAVRHLPGEGSFSSPLPVDRFRVFVRGKRAARNAPDRAAGDDPPE